MYLMGAREPTLSKQELPGGTGTRRYWVLLEVCWGRGSGHRRGVGVRIKAGDFQKPGSKVTEELSC